MKIPSKLLTLCGVLTLSLIANAGTITTYSGQDDGASATGPWPLSAAAQASLLAAAGPTNTLTFESLTPGYSSTIAAAADYTVAEVNEIVAIGDIEPIRVGTPCILVDAVVQGYTLAEQEAVFQDLWTRGGILK